MSDYLWDKTGEPDEEVERLEALLGTLAHRPRPLALPAPDAHAAHAPGRASRLFAPWALAAAAALLVATLAGAAALLRSRETPMSKESAAAHETRPPRAEAAPEKSPEAITREQSTAAPSPARGAQGGGASKDERAAVEDFRPGSRAGRATRVASAQRRQKGSAPPARGGAAAEGGGTAFEALSADGGAPSLFESTRLVTKEQLVYALRLTGAKLRDVRQKTRQGLRQEASEQP